MDNNLASIQTLTVASNGFIITGAYNSSTGFNMTNINSIAGIFVSPFANVTGPTGSSNYYTSNLYRSLFIYNNGNIYFDWNGDIRSVQFYNITTSTVGLSLATAGWPNSTELLGCKLYIQWRAS